MEVKRCREYRKQEIRFFIWMIIWLLFGMALVCTVSINRNEEYQKIIQWETGIRIESFEEYLVYRNLNPKN